MVGAHPAMSGWAPICLRTARVSSGSSETQLPAYLGSDACALGASCHGALRCLDRLTHGAFCGGIHSGDRAGNNVTEFVVTQLLWEVLGDHTLLGPLPVGLLGPAGVGES